MITVMVFYKKIVIETLNFVGKEKYIARKFSF